MSIDDPLIGKTLGDYKIQSLLGRGGMSRVYKGYDENLQRHAAVKVISGDFATTTEEEYTRRFTSEARAIAHLRHPSIVGVYQFGRIEGIYYMAQVFLEGRDLRQLLKEYAERGRYMPGDEVVRIVRDVADALDYAHMQGVIHRDIKPSNIMLEKRTDRAILMDFGLALSVHEGTMGDTFGSAHYIAPEQAVSSAKAVPQSDLYSLGIVIYEMVAGKVPFDDPSVMSVALKHLNELPPPPTMYNPDLPVGVETVIMRALDKNPARRYPTGKELVAELEKAFAGGQVAGPPLPVDDTTKPLEDEADNGFIAHPMPSISTASKPDKSGSEPSGITGRFARRRAKREEEAAVESLTEDELEIDNDTLGSLLDSMPDPSDIGLVGRDARGVTPRPQHYASDPRQPIARMLGADSPSQARASEQTEKRRSRLGIILPVLLVLIVLIGAVVFGPQLIGDDGGENNNSGGISGADSTATKNAAAEQTALALALASQTPIATAEPTIEPTTEPTTEPTIEPTIEPTTEPTTGSDSLTETASAIAQLTETVEAVATNTQEPTTAAPTRTPTATDEPTAAITSEPTETETPPETPEQTPEEPPPAAVAMVDTSATYKPNIRLIYNENELLLLNISGDTLDISDLVFEQALPDGETLEFRTVTWDNAGVVDSTDDMREASCYQLVTSEATQNDPETITCPSFQGYFRSLTSERYFWISDDPDAEFTVRIAGHPEAAATCEIATGECEFYAGLEANAVLIEPTPSMANFDEAPNIHLIYDRTTFVLINISDQPLNVSNLVFEQELPTGVVRVFLVAEWDDEPDIVDPTSSLRAGGCYELITTEGGWYRPDRTICTSFLGWFRSNNTTRYFWRSSQPDAGFIVRFQDSRTPLAMCEISAGECSFYMPPEGEIEE